MSRRRRFRRRPDQFVVAVQLRLDTDGFDFRKWGGVQHCKANDWIVDDEGEIHTVDADSFARTYRELRRGAFIKTAPVWAEQAEDDGSVTTKEGRTNYVKGDWLVSNNEDGSDAYAIGGDEFRRRYELDE